MAEEPEITADFPRPPIYYQSFGEVAAVTEPPKPPADGVFSLFGEQRKLVEVTPTLEDQGLKTLFNPKADRKTELKRLVNVSRKRFLDVLSAVTENSAQGIIDERVNELDVCFINMLYMVNELREEQAKVSIQEMLKNQVKAKKQSCSLLDLACDKSQKEILEAFDSATNLAESPALDISMLDASSEQTTKEDQRGIVDAAVKRMKGM